ncbi:hypothetical protein GAY30_34275, partial [Azospirillum brasilense]|nr:hypothetical protein [Azospirillum brasilense]
NRRAGGAGEAWGVPARLFALGPVSRAPFWEMTAVPELRSQCADASLAPVRRGVRKRLSV